MLINRVTPALLLAAALLSAGQCQAGTWPERPRLEDYREYPQFLQAMTAYRNALKAIRFKPPLSMSIPVPVNTTLQELATTSAEMMDPLSEDYPAPLQITGPEDMEDAVEKAKAFRHPVYTAPLRYKRTTSFSFPLARASNDLLETATATDVFWGATGAEGELLLANMLYGDELLSAEHAGTSHERWAELTLNNMSEGLLSMTGASITLFGANADVMIESVRR